MGPARARGTGQRAGASLGAGGHAGVRDSEAELGGLSRHVTQGRHEVTADPWERKWAQPRVRDLYALQLTSVAGKWLHV